jgi:hypothetical protein
MAARLAVKRQTKLLVKTILTGICFSGTKDRGFSPSRPFFVPYQKQSVAG